MRLDQARHLAPVVAFAVERDRVLDAARVLHLRGRRALQLAPALLRQAVGGARLQEVAQHRVVLVQRLRLRVAHRDEIVVARKPGEQLGGALVAGKRARHRGCHLRQVGGVQQELLRARVGFLEDLAREVIEHQLAARQPGRVGNLALLQHQHQARSPALGARIKRVHRLGGESGPASGGDRTRLLAREAQLLPADHGKRLVRAQASQRRGRVAAADHEHAPARRQRLERDAHHLVQLRGRRHRMVAVEHHRERRLELRVQALEIAPREHREPGLVLRREERQTLMLPVEPCRGEAEVVEKRGDVGVALVELVPERRNAGVVEPARGKRGLAASGRAGDPGGEAVCPYRATRTGACAAARRPRSAAWSCPATPSSLSSHSPRTAPSRLGSAPPRQPPGTRSMPCSPLVSTIVSTW